MYWRLPSESQLLMAVAGRSIVGFPGKNVFGTLRSGRRQERSSAEYTNGVPDTVHLQTQPMY